MPKKKKTYLDFEIDKLTNSIENTLTGEEFNTDVVPFTAKEKNFNRKKWIFDWQKEMNDQHCHVYKLVIREYPEVIQGLISIKHNHDHIFMNLIESAGFNLGKNKMYFGVPGNLIAYACKISFESGYNGIVSFIAKTVLMNHYHETIGAKHIGKNVMFIDTMHAEKLVKKYFKI